MYHAAVFETPTRRAVLGLAPSIGLGALFGGSGCGRHGEGAVKVGVLHSLTGTMAISETSVVDATRLALEQINEAGGVLDRPLVPVVVDGRSDAETFAREAERLITEERVDVVFGCWTSASRRTVRPVFERLNHLLFYPVQYEGLEQSPNIVYTGASPNQQIIPAVKWSFDNLGSRAFLIGSDYVFPRTANALIRAQVDALRGTIVGETYLRLGTKDVESAVNEIALAKPDVILNSVNGDTNVALFRALRKAGIPSTSLPVMSFSLAEDELRSIDPEDVVGNYATWSYFQSVESPENHAFVDAFRRRYGADRVTDDPMEAAYFGVQLWKQAVTEAQATTPREVRAALGRQSYQAPEGLVSIDSATQHTWKIVRVGRIRGDGQFDIVWTSDKPVRPVPYPIHRAKAQWEQFLAELHDGWGGAWAPL